MVLKLTWHGGVNSLPNEMEFLLWILRHLFLRSTCTLMLRVLEVALLGVESIGCKCGGIQGLSLSL